MSEKSTVVDCREPDCMAENSRETGFCIFVSSQTQTQIAVYGQTDSTGHFLKHWEHVDNRK